MLNSSAFKKLLARFAGTMGAILLARFLGMTINIGLLIFILILIVILFRRDYNEESTN